jgi:hypothetical protein
LEVTWKTDVTHSVFDEANRLPTTQSKNLLPDKLIKKAEGSIIFSESGAKLAPIKSFPEMLMETQRN